jgi:phosphoglycerate dehydrogenase-like enzyme
MGEQRFRVGVTRDLRAPDGSFVFAPADLGLLERAGLEWEYLAREDLELPPGSLRAYDALYHLGPVVSAASLDGADRLVLLARSGVGLDAIDLDACTENGVAVTITADAIRRPMASAAVAFVLALAHRVIERNAAFHAGRWHEGRFGVMGFGLSGRTLGVIGFGRIGREVVRLLEPWEMRVLVTTRTLSDDEAAAAGVARAELDVLLRESDVVVVACPLTSQTRGLLDERRLGLLKPSAVLVNVARGPIVDQSALARALREGRLAGAGLDVFEREPVDADDPLLGLPNLVAAPHSAGYSDELFGGCVEQACRAILDVASGRVPADVVNPAVLESTRFRTKLALLREPVAT